MKNGEIFKVWSDNTSDCTVDVYPLDEQFDVESTQLQTFNYSDVEKIDTNLSILRIKSAN